MTPHLFERTAASAVAQICNLLYRGFSIRRHFEIADRVPQRANPQNTILRHSRFQICATTALFATFAISVLGADGPTNSAAKPKPKPKPIEHTYGRAAAQADMAKLIVAQGLEATLFACEPMVVNPCDMDV